MFVITDYAGQMITLVMIKGDKLFSVFIWNIKVNEDSSNVESLGIRGISQKIR